ncbi:cytochrome P450, partial [Mycena leptocephala]
MWADGKHHPIHRQALAPMFGGSAIDSYCPIFFNMVNKVWALDEQCRVSHCRRRFIRRNEPFLSSLDSLGTAGFGHDFQSLMGDYCLVTAAFYTLRAPGTNSPSDIIFRLASTMPVLRNIPTAKNRIINDFQACMSRIASDILERNARKAETEDRSVLVKALADNPAGEFRLSHAEVLAQVVSPFPLPNLVGGWLFVELAKNPAVQDKVRNELQQLSGNIEYSEILKLSYLHSVVYEALRLHPPMGDTTRVAVEDDNIPLSFPILTKSGKTVTSIHVGKGTAVVAPIQYVNTSEAFWGSGAANFDPGRWWQDKSNNDFPGNRHLAFGDGPRTCIGADFSLALIKIVLSVVIGNFAISLLAGPQTNIESGGGRIPQPRVSGQ